MENNFMNNFLCEICNNRWQSKDGLGTAKCPKCGESFEIRRTMSREDAEKLGLTEE